MKRHLSGFCNPTLPRTPAYDPHLRCPGCDCRADGCPCNPEEPPVTRPDLTTTLATLATLHLGGPPDVPAVPTSLAQRAYRLRDAAAAVAEVPVAGLTWEEAVQILRVLQEVTHHVGTTVNALDNHAYLHGEHGDVEVEGVGRVHIGRTRDRKQWDGSGLAQAVIDAHMEEAGMEEAPPPWEVAGWLLEAMAVGYGRVTILRRLGIPPDEFCDSKPGRPKVGLPAFKP